MELVESPFNENQRIEVYTDNRHCTKYPKGHYFMNFETGDVYKLAEPYYSDGVVTLTTQSSSLETEENASDTVFVKVDCSEACPIYLKSIRRNSILREKYPRFPSVKELVNMKKTMKCNELCKYLLDLYLSLE